MDNNKTIGKEYYANLLQQIGALFNLSLPEIKYRHEDYPHCLLDYFEKGSTEKAIEIRFDKEEITIVCIFNADKICDFVYLFPDKKELIEEFIIFLKEHYEYDFIKNRWEMSECFIAIKEVSHLPNDLCLTFYC